MIKRIVELYYRVVLHQPVAVLIAVVALLAVSAHQAQYFELDASSESLMLEGDRDLETFRTIRAKYGSSDMVFVTFTPKGDLFADETLDRIDALRAELAALEDVDSVLTLLDVPLLRAPGVNFDTLGEGIPTLRDSNIPREQAKAELRESPLYRDLILSDDADTTMLIVQFKADPQYQQLLDRLRELRNQRETSGLDAAQRRALNETENRLDARSDVLQVQLEKDIAKIRVILDEYRDPARIHLGGVPMIAVDMIDFVRKDIRTFGIGVGLFIIVLLALAFRRPRWVIVPATICAATVAIMVGWIGFAGWPVTVVSSNFISLVLIVTLSLIVHMIVRYRELHAGDPAQDQRALLRGTIDTKFQPSFFTSLTTSISFGSLMFADIQPVIDFGLMMTCSVVLGFVLTFVLFPSMLARLSPRNPQRLQHDVLGRVNIGLSRWVHRNNLATGLLFVLLFVLGVAGALRLTVENRFIDYFHEDTEIYQGMLLIDQKLGGTTPLDVVLDAPQWFVEEYQAEREFQEELGLVSEPSPVDGYWYNARNLERLTEIQDYLESLEATGKILSIGTVWEVVKHLNEGEPLEPYELGILYKRLPPDLKNQFLDRYMTEDGMEVRFDIRVIDSLPGLERNRLLQRIRTELPQRFDLQPEQVTLSGMLVLYNNVMQSLFRSQVVTLVIVFGAIMIMFGALYRSLRMAIIGPIPTVVAASMVLGIMGWIGLPLDIMTMTIAAIVIGIGVDDTIHYVDRYQHEIEAGNDDAHASDTAHGEVGRAMVYTTVIVTLGFSILTLSNFMPSVYFGLLTGLAMIFALISNLALLPVLLQRLRPFSP
ncbi:MAG: efflux RND transporter permease subunit [Halofilum sp. (in: g-proteobacteria)]|nr:efflux RND transporter permease subunit [Halofilum sp. (in: g-proteobacteria)]